MVAFPVSSEKKKLKKLIEASDIKVNFITVRAVRLENRQFSFFFLIAFIVGIEDLGMGKV